MGTIGPCGRLARCLSLYLFLNAPGPRAKKAMSNPLTPSAGAPDETRPTFAASHFRALLQISRRRPVVASGITCAVLIALAIAGIAAADDNHSNPWLLSWIPATCCVTNDCCWEISEREVRPLPNDEWQIVSTGQVRKRTDWSPDGKFYRCACDYDQTDKHWIRHQGANTRCLFVPMRTAGRWLGLN